MLLSIAKNGGAAGAVTFMLSVLAVMLVIKLVLDLKREKIVPPGVLDDVEGALADEDFEEAYGIVQDDQSFLGRTLEGGLSKMNYGYEAIEKGADEAWVNEQTSLMQTASYVQLIGQTAPMLGLFGTVWGMMDAFKELASSAGAADPQELANGIMKSLATTFIGLFVAIPTNALYLFIRNKIVAAGLEVATYSSDTLAVFRGEDEE
jgi:biopolymer transport protein ExbB